MNMLKNNKGILSIVLLLVFTLLTGCSGSTAEGSKGSYKAGSYTAEAKGHNGNIKVEVIVDEESIKEVKVLEHKETKGVADAAITNIPEGIVKEQTLAVDTITGCTVSSKAILAAVEDALTQADGDIAALKVKKEKNNTAQKIIKETDVVVVGAGIAGLSAAIEAADNGAKVILLEKMPAVGGSTIRSGAKILAAESSIQKAAGIEDSAEDFADFLMEIGEGKVDKDFVSLIANNSAENIEWLMDNGVKFKDEIEPLHSYRTPARGHKVYEDSGANLIMPLQDKAKELGVEILLQTPALSLITEGEKVTGVKAENSNGDEITINAGAVILATGGFDRNPELVKKYFPSAGEFTTTVGEGNTGDGLIMGEEAGAQILKNDAGIRLALNRTTMLGYGEAADGLFVTPEGKRFMDEKDFHFTRTRIMYDLNIEHCFYIFDESDYNEKVGKAIEEGTAFEADSIEDLAGKIGMDSKVLKATVDRYNELAKKGKDDDFNKPSEFLTAIAKGKLYAVKLSGNTSGTIGGLKITIDGEVLNIEDKVISGLYAAGEVANGQIFYREYPGSGSSIIANLTFGRQAGAAAAKNVQGK
ncbi:flavocytochrome c [Alloiococcus sp. CFN-8]|uniref:flavocytochrome c n=1 Tax=Alloiococcus sp. CFN-8 TaxID=3416081 RepID=UPI003CE743B4